MRSSGGVFPISVFEPQYCDPNYPQVFCSSFPSLATGPCTASRGSPVVCISGHVSGFVINERGCTTADAHGRNLLHYHSVNDFRAWIEEVSGAEKAVKSSIVLIISAGILSVKRN